MVVRGKTKHASFWHPETPPTWLLSFKAEDYDIAARQDLKWYGIVQLRL